MELTLLYGVYGGLCILFLYFSLSVLKRDSKNRINQMFFLFLFTSACGLIVTLIYRTINNEILNPIGNMISIYLNTFTLIFWLLFNLIINKGDTIITDKKKIIYIVIWAIICSIIFMIPGGVHFENEESIYSAPFAIYGLIIITAIYVFILKVQYGNYNKFDEPSLKKKYRNQIIGIILFMWVLIGTYLSNWFNIPQFRTFFTYTALIIYPAGILLYNGVKKE